MSSKPAAAQETVLHSFGAGTDGIEPEAGLVDVGGVFYGTTLTGGSHNDGTAFSIDPNTGDETVLHSFCSRHLCKDGDSLYVGLVDVNGILYGTTVYGGTGSACGSPYNCGTVFKLDPTSGVEKVVYSFCGQQNCTDGANPAANVINVKGTLYGTTYGGGAQNVGTVFSVDPKTGAEKTIYSFCSQSNCTDGGQPTAGLIDVKGTLYGTASYGGNNACGCGTVFAFNLNTGTETTLYSFCGLTCSDGAQPAASLVYFKGLLYGTTTYGGVKCGYLDKYGCGTVFSVDPNTGAEKVLYIFSGGTDGGYPDSNLINLNGTLYGTAGGGAREAGVVFSIKP